MHKAGEILEVSPTECSFLVSTDGAIIIDAVKADKVVETPEDKTFEEEVPEKKVKTVRTAVKKPVTRKK